MWKKISVLFRWLDNANGKNLAKCLSMYSLTGILSLVLMMPVLVGAQQATQSSLGLLNPFQWNPAFAGIQGKAGASLGARLQWTGLEGAPVTQVVNFHAPFEILGGGLGLKMENDALGAAQSLRALIAYNYQLPLGEGVLGMGVGAGIVRRILDGSKLRTPEGSYLDNFADHRDALLTLGRMQGAAPVLEAGVYYYSPRFEVGFALSNVNRPGIGMGTFQWSEIPVFFANATYNIELSPTFAAQSALWARGDRTQVQTDLALIFQYKQNISVGASLRGYDSDSLDALAFIAGFQLSEKLRLAYAWDWTLSPLQQASSGSHELLLTYALPKILGRLRLPPIIYNPRNL